MNVFDLAAKISLDTSDYEKSLDDASTSSSNFASKLSSGLQTAAKVTAAAVTTVVSTAVTIGKTIYEQANAMSQYGDTIDKMSQKLGMSAESYQQWDYVLQLAGADISSLKVGMKTLSSTIVDASNGSDSAAKKIQAIGLSVEQLNGLSQEDQFALVVNA